MRTLSLIILCLIILAPSTIAAKLKDNDADRKTRVESSSDSTDKASDSSSSSSSKSSSDSGSSYKPSETNSSSNSAYHPSTPEPARSTPREDPKPVVRSDPKPVEDTNHSSNAYRPSNRDPEPAKYTPPTASAYENKPADNSNSSLARKETKLRDRTAEESSTQSDTRSQYKPDNYSTSGNVAINKPDTSSSSTAPNGSVYHPTNASSKSSTSANNTKSTNTSNNTYRPSGGSDVTGNTTYKPTNSSGYSPKADAKPDQKATDAQTKTQRDTVKPTYKPNTPTSYKPTGQTTKPSGTVGRTTNPAGYSPSTNTVNPAYKPANRTYKVGYRPSAQSRPSSYKPPRLQDGRYIYTTPPIVEDGRWYHPRPRFHRPCYYGHWADDYYPGFSWRSSFYYFGIYPFIEVSRIREYSYETIEFVSEPIYVSGRSYTRNAQWERIDEALADIRSAWIAGRFDLLERHVLPKADIAVLIDGEYDYAISTEDYLAMTEDALADLNTVSYLWTKVRERSDGAIMAFAEHSYWANDRARTVYVSYTLNKVGRDYFITEIGSSAKPLNW